jgi:molybdopterin synthase catalytic subunit
VTGSCDGAYHLSVPDSAPLTPPAGDDWVALTRAPLDAAAAVSWAGTAGCGGVVSFVGVVRDHAEGRTGVVAVDYEAYEEPVRARLGDLVAAVRERVADLGRVAVWHRVGRVELREASVVVVVSAPHRAEAFEANRWLIDTLKATLPIWKYEHWAGGSDWSPANRPIEEIAAEAEGGGR